LILRERFRGEAMHTILAMLHPLTAALRMLRGAMYHYGPGVLGKHMIACAWLICGLCLCAGVYDWRRGRRLDALLWAGLAALLFPAFWMETTLSMHVSRTLALTSLAPGAWLLGKNLMDAVSGRREPAQRYP
jgi:hypothetical protein